MNLVTVAPQLPGLEIEHERAETDPHDHRIRIHR